MVDMKSLFEAERARRIEAKRATAAAEETSSSSPSNADATLDEIRRAAPAPCDLSPRTPLRLADHAVGADRGVAGLHYVPDFLSADEEAAVLRGVYAPDAAARWVASGRRRVQNWGGRPSEVHVAEPLPPFAAALARAVSDAGVVAEGTAPNHVLVNEYRRPAGIAPHNDGDIYNPRVGASASAPSRSTAAARSYTSANLNTCSPITRHQSSMRARSHRHPERRRVDRLLGARRPRV
jgi:alkylated DNA repair protein alkB family protein 6